MNDCFNPPDEFEKAHPNVMADLRGELRDAVDWFTQVYMNWSPQVNDAYKRITGIAWEIARRKCQIPVPDDMYVFSLKFVDVEHFKT